ncbi:MAG: hypothetical protein M1547_03165 [Gammaproteobacteria bacterium]|nr:hypothetical protein [Gammaproteobacteria bacterium]
MANYGSFFPSAGMERHTAEVIFHQMLAFGSWRRYRFIHRFITDAARLATWTGSQMFPALPGVSNQSRPSNNDTLGFKQAV